MMTRTARIAAAVAVAALAACGGSGGYGSVASPPPPGNGRTIDATPSLAFTPDQILVNVGDVVTFDFGSVPHNVYFDTQAGSPADITGSNANVSTQRTFTTAGTYHYTCHIHPLMQGTVVVR